MDRTFYQKPFFFRRWLHSWVSSLFLITSLSMGFIHCAKPQALIPGTKIPATPINVEILRRVDEAFQAFREKDISKLLSMVHESYGSNGGTPDPRGHYNKKGLQDMLEKLLPRLRSIQFMLKYRDVTVEGDRATVHLKYDIRFQLATEQGDRWRDGRYDREMVLIRENGQWYFVSGY